MDVILNNYYLICDPYIGIGRGYIKIINCASIKYSNKMDLPWNTYL